LTLLGIFSVRAGNPDLGTEFISNSDLIPEKIAMHRHFLKIKIKIRKRKN
jgi:hypothetical protein